MYILKNQNNELLEGAFYSSELARTEAPKKDRFYPIKKILGERINPKTGKRQFKVRFDGYTREFDRFIDADQLKDM